ncbi:hypothetical protein C7212DRAFT_343044 [Tuber magnatum]|uniref:FAD-binding FR-type domain-containing protein n=1 Tax=Tuber magnatum TaxID=42249 RepID=A0A317SS64_9PEZI|nr:hypothetical protein C7212DRAFT_343044 [Tuber magnatum]
MNSVQWYSVALGALVALPTLFLLTVMLPLHLYNHVNIPIRRYLIYAMVPRWLGGPNRLSRFQAVAIVCGMAANWLCIMITADGASDIRSRTGQLATIHMILLCLGSRMNLLTSYTYLSPHGQQIAHSWLGWITISNGVVHSIIVLGIERRLQLDVVGISGLVAGVAMLTMTLLSPLLSYARTYETTVNGHIALGACLLGSLWYHLYAVPFREGLLYLNIAIGLLVIGYISRFGHIWHRSCGTSPNARLLSVRPLVDAIQISIVVPRPWHFRAGQHIYLPVFGMVEGPFGTERDLGSYGTVLMFASGVGKAAQIPYIRRLLEGRSMSKARTQSIVIYWKLDSEGEAQRSPHMPGAGNYNDPLTRPASEEHFGEHDRVNRVFGDLDIKYTLSAELDRRRGNTVVAVCAGPPMIDEVRSTVRGALRQDIWLVELGLWPGPSSDILPPLGPRDRP